MAGIATKMQYGMKYWRLAIHLIFKTKRFGVNNQWWARQPSPIGWEWYQIVWGVLSVMPIVRNYQSMKVRSCIGWMPQAECEALFGSKKA
ncbi:hypothetical protein [Thiomicrospira microaerophila]|uniref:hypothetical protein n=1 Tax=Thiomicrospira microaerophila TaxID=406020 RepID=UPI000A6E7B0A|nr:hypothetical protein [Thiomicrospira microaerophila]